MWLILHSLFLFNLFYFTSCEGDESFYYYKGFMNKEIEKEAIFQEEPDYPEWTYKEFLSYEESFEYFNYNAAVDDEDIYGQEELIDYYEELIDEGMEKAMNYEFPKDASQYKTRLKHPKCYGEYDFVIVGGGTAGSILANRLSEVAQWKILVLEAGEYGNNLTAIPNMNFPTAFSDYNWGYTSTPQETACLGMVERKCPYPRGKGVGGSSLINGMIYARGHRQDFDLWADMGNPGWSYEEVLPYFKKSENFNHNDKESEVDEQVHGKGGYMNVEYHDPRHGQLEAFLEANEEIGTPIVDYNSDSLGASHMQVTTRNGRREDTGSAFLLSVKDRPNLKVLTSSYAVKIHLKESSKKAKGVLFSYKGELNYVRARKEVIVSCGSINSPHLLMLSGIGPKKHLKEVGIKPVKNLEVGSLLQDHPGFFGLSFESNYSDPIRPVREYIEEFLQGKGPYASPQNNQGIAFYESSYTKGTGIADIEIMIITSNASSPLLKKSHRLTDQTYKEVFGSNVIESTFLLFVYTLHAISTGTVRLRSNDPFDYPVIDSRPLSDPEGRDIKVLYEGTQIALKLAETEAFQKIGAKLQTKPMKACSDYEYLSEEYWHCAIRQVTWHEYHPVATCPMGPDPRQGAVVNNKCKVYGFKNLRVIDASVMPFSMAGHPYAAVMMIAEKMSDEIKSQYGKL